MASNSDIIPTIQNLIRPHYKTVLDIGCGHTDSSFESARIREKEDIALTCFSGLEITGIDAYAPCIEYRRRHGPPGNYFATSLKDAVIGNKFDIVLFHHVIEHMAKDDGLETLSKLQKICNGVLIVGCPNGFIENSSEENPFQKHISGWTVEEFVQLGYRIDFDKYNILIASMNFEDK